MRNKDTLYSTGNYSHYLKKIFFFMEQHKQFTNIPEDSLSIINR